MLDLLWIGKLHSKIIILFHTDFLILPDSHNNECQLVYKGIIRKRKYQLTRRGPVLRFIRALPLMFIGKLDV